MFGKKKVIFLILIFLFLGGSFSVGYLLGKSSVVCRVCQPEDINFSLFWDVYKKLGEKFVSPEKIDAKKIIYGAISGMVKSLEDPYTVFFPPEETKRFMEDVQGSFEGVGMEIDVKKGQLLIISPLEGTPAQKAGLKPEDQILEINGTSTADLTIEQAVNLIRGPKGTGVVLTIFRKDWERPKEIKLIREKIEVPSLKWELKEGKDGQKIAYLKLYQFSEKAGFDFRVAAIEILSSPAQKIILDLRNNPGGYLEVAQDIAGWFLEEKQIVAIEDFGGDKKKNEYKSEGNGRLLDYPIVVLINGGSASASEILAGALRDNRKVLLIGEKSFGKGSVQELEKLKDGSSLKITVAKWLTPKGEQIGGKGLEPDVKIEMTDEDYRAGKDPQLGKALETIEGMR